MGKCVVRGGGRQRKISEGEWRDSGDCEDKDVGVWQRFLRREQF